VAAPLAVMKHALAAAVRGATDTRYDGSRNSAPSITASSVPASHLCRASLGTGCAFRQLLKEEQDGDQQRHLLDELQRVCTRGSAALDFVEAVPLEAVVPADERLKRQEPHVVDVRQFVTLPLVRVAAIQEAQMIFLLELSTHRLVDTGLPLERHGGQA
jgi:hypothetical protein